MDLRVTAQTAGERGFEAATLAGDWVKRWRRRLATFTLCLLAVPLAYRVVWGANGWLAYQNKRHENHELLQQVDQLRKENDDLERRVEALKKNDPKTIEREAREQLRYAKPGELIYVLPQRKPVQPAPPANATAEKNPKP